MYKRHIVACEPEYRPQVSPVPIVIKGIMTSEDTALAVGAGASGVVVSNHGGRQLDGTDGTIEVA